MKTAALKSQDSAHFSHPFLNGNDKPFFGSQTIQPKLKVGQPNDKYEQQADRVADAVMRMPDPAVQRQPEEEEEPIQMQEEEELQMQPLEEEEQLQKKAGVQVSGESFATQTLSNQIQSHAGSGSSLPGPVQSEMSSKMGADFSGVNIHTGTEAIQMNRQLGAKAFTHGRDIFFNSGQYNPASPGGKHLLAHELTHVVQQAGPAPSVQGKLELRPPGKGEASAFDRADELIKRLNTLSAAIQYTLNGQNLEYTVHDKKALTHFDSKMKAFIDDSQVIPMRLITAQGYVGGGPLMADSFISGYVDIDDLLANDIYSFQSDLLHFLTERFQVKDYERIIGTNFSSKFPKAHRAGKEAEAENLRAIFNDPSITFLYEETKASGTWINAFKSKDHGYRVYQMVKNPSKEMAGGVMWVRKKDGNKVSMDDFRKERNTVKSAP